MAFVLTQFEVEDFDAWKQMFDTDPGGRTQGGKGHRVFRGVDNPNQVFVSTEWPSADDAKSFLDRLRASGALGNFTVKTGPTITELVDSADY